VLARMIGQKLTEGWKQQVVVENKPGAAGNIAMEYVQRARPDGYTLILGHVGTLALAVGSAKRIPSLPDVPTVAESGYPGFETSQWYGILAPAGTPERIVTKLSDEIRRILKQPDVTGRLSADGSVALAMSPQEFAVFVRKEMERWGAVVKKAGIKVD
jgi:tripartite-type tricarboxylate transporter receptor subunit TctC